jgi:hypothetical protein
MSAIIQGLSHAWKKNSEYAERLVSDLYSEQMILQPAPEGKAAANHPAWILSHLNVYVPIINAMVQGVAFEDPKDHQFGMNSKPESDGAIYASKDDLLKEFVEGHESVAKLLESADASFLENDISLERWKSVMPKVGIALPYLMLLHENQHLGQLSAWRRIQGMPSV